MEVTHPSPSTATASDATTNFDNDDEYDNEKGDLCFFAGAGFDSLMLHDFQQVKAWSKNSSPSSSAVLVPSFIKDALSSVMGYCVALVTKTLPQTIRYGTHKIHVKVTTEDVSTLWVDHRRGDFSELAVPSSSTEAGGSSKVNGRESPSSSSSSSPDEESSSLSKDKNNRHLIYSGTTGIIAASTTPYYGGGMRLFPYARLFPTKLQLRLGRISPWTGFLNIPKIFEGSYRETSEKDFGCLDFVGEEFEVRVKGVGYEEYVKRKSEEKKKRKKGGRGGTRRSLLRWLSRRRARKESDGEEDGNSNSGSSSSSSNGETIQGSAKGFPFQHSGESMGIKERFRLRVVQEPVKFVSFLEPRVVVDD